METIAFTLDEKESVSEFIETPWRILGPDALWVPPLKAGVRAELSPQRPFFQHGTARAFLVRQNHGVVGRVLASLDRSLRQGPREKIGHFGYFECVDDTAVAKSLLGAAESWLAEQGATAVHGPVNLIIMHGYRMQTAGFATEPFLGEPRNPAYYPKLLEECGYRAANQWRSWDLGPRVVAEIAEHAKRKAHQYAHRFLLRPFDWAQAEREIEEFYPLALSTFSSNYGYSNISPEELSLYFQPILLLLRRGLFTKAYDDSGRPIGFTFGYWDIAPALQYANGDAAVFRRPEALPPAHRFLIHTFAVLREHQKLGVGYALLASILDYAAASGLPAIGCLVREGASIFDSFGGPTRSYHILVKDLVRI